MSWWMLMPLHCAGLGRHQCLRVSQDVDNLSQMRAPAAAFYNFGRALLLMATYGVHEMQRVVLLLVASLEEGLD
jgi:hypothetical protein